MLKTAHADGRPPKKGDALIVVPPFGFVKSPALGPHLLQAAASKAGFSTYIYYASMEHARLIGYDLFNAISENMPYGLWGERLFSRMAFNTPLLGFDRFGYRSFDTYPDHTWCGAPNVANKVFKKEYLSIANFNKKKDWEQLALRSEKWVQELVETLVRLDYKVIGCTTTVSSLSFCIALLKKIKEIRPDIITVIGGVLCSGDLAKGYSKLAPEIDYVFSGESEDTFVDFLNKVKHGQRPVEHIIVPAEQNVDVNTNATPDYSDFVNQFKRAFPNEGYSLTLETSRECYWDRCTFCGIPGRGAKYRFKSSDRVFQEIQEILANHNPIRIDFTDNILPVRYFKSDLFTKISKLNRNVSFCAEVKAKLSLREVAQLKKANFTVIQPGIESLSSSVLKRMRKGIRAKDVIATLRYAVSARLYVMWNLLIGLPKDTKSDYQELLNFLPYVKHLPAPNSFSPVRLLRFSDYTKNPKKFGIDNLRPASIYKDLFPPEADTQSLATYYTGNFSSYSIHDPETALLLKKEYDDWVRLWANGGINSRNYHIPLLRVKPVKGDLYEIVDTRKLHGDRNIYKIDRETARTVLFAKTTDFSNLQWVFDKKILLKEGDEIIPLATADLRTFTELETA